MTDSAERRENGAEHEAGKDTSIVKALEELGRDMDVAKMLERGDRVELIPVKDGIKAMHAKRREIKKFSFDKE